MKNYFSLICFLTLFGWGGLPFIAEVRAETPEEPGKNELLDDLGVIDLIQSKSIPKRLTKKPGNAVRGEALMINRKKGNCLACHRLSAFEGKAKKKPNAYGDMGEIGPSLDGIASRYDQGQLRLLLVDAKVFFPETIMPSFYKNSGLHRVGKSFDRKTILEKQEIEDILAFLITLKEKE